jgi:predicted RNase H-like HicB family nuclease
MTQLPPLTAVICLEYNADGTPAYVAHCMELGIASQGDTTEEARAILQEAVEGVLEVAGDEEIERRIEEGGHAIALVALEVSATSVRIAERGAAGGDAGELSEAVERLAPIYEQSLREGGELTAFSEAQEDLHEYSAQELADIGSIGAPAESTLAVEFSNDPKTRSAQIRTLLTAPVEVREATMRAAANLAAAWYEGAESRAELADGQTFEVQRENGMYESDRCGFCSGFEEKRHPWVCGPCSDKVLALAQTEGWQVLQDQKKV